MKKTISILATAAALVLAGCTDNFKEVPSVTGQTITQVAAASDNFNVLTALLVKTGLNSSFDNNNSGSFTVFAPTDAAFVSYFNAAVPALSSGVESDVLNWIGTTLSTSSTPSIATLANILNNHVVSSKISSSQITGAQGFVTIGGTARLSASKVGANIVLNANRAGQNVVGNGGQSVTLDINASNGVIHSIDKVLIPVTLANIWIGTSPSSGAFVDLPGFNVDYTTLTGGFPTVSVFGVPMPRKSDGTINIATAAVGTLNNYNIISAAIARAELAPVIRPVATPFPDFTLFAPTDAAFITYLSALPGSGVSTEATAITYFNSITPAAAAAIVNYHLVAGRVVSTDLSNGSVTTLLTGKTFTVTLGPNITLTDGKSGVSTITSANILTNAGVVHQINKVLESN